MGDDTGDLAFTRRSAVVLAGLAAAFLAGLVVVGVAGAFETNDDCSPYGYGGYSCVDYGDAVLTVNPATDLVDGQLVSVSGQSFDPAFAVFVASQCVAADLGNSGQGGCDSTTRVITTLGANGAVGFSMRLKRIIETPDLGPVDCAVDSCVVGAATIEVLSSYPTTGGTDPDYVVLEGATAAISFDPDVPPIDYDDGQIFVTPSEDLVDRQTVTVTGVDLDPHFGSFGVALCDASLVEASQSDGCDLSTSRISTVDGEGNAEVELTVRRIITTSAGGEVDCAVPGACEIGGGTFSGFATAIEGGRVPVHFDPDMPPVPPLEFGVEIDEVSASAVTGTATCNREAELQLDFSIVQEKGNGTATAYGYLYADAACDEDGDAFTIPLMSGGRRLTGGPAHYDLWAYAYDGFESVYETESATVNLRGGPRATPLATVTDGVDTTVEIVGVQGRGSDQEVVVEVVCGRAGEYVSVSVSVRQWAGRDLVDAYGFSQVPDCLGVHRVNVPITADGGVLVGGPATADVQATLHDHRPPPDYYHDYASASREVHLTGRTDAPSAFDPQPDPDSRITIGEVSRSTISGTVECGDATMVEIYAAAVQARGRKLSQVHGYQFVECDGTADFEIETAGDTLGGGSAAVSVSAYGYRLVEMDGYDSYEYVWDDVQQATVRVRGSG